MVRRFFLAISLCTLLMIGTVDMARAQEDFGSKKFGDDVTPTSSQDYKIHQEEVDAYNLAVKNCSSPSLECLVRNTTRFVAIEWVNDIIGPSEKADAGGPTGAQGPSTGSTIADGSGGIVRGVFGLISNMYEYQPANTSRYVADVMDNAGMAPPAYAQGLGFASLDPILGLWKMFRNIAYFFFIAILIIIGIMIMLRQKISAQASVGAQQALPGIIISLILVTFSYAIAGLMIDVMYLSMFLIARLFDNLSKANAGMGTELMSKNILELGMLLFTDSGVNSISTNITAITAIIRNLGDSGPIGGFLGILGGLTLSIVIAIAVLIGTVKLFFELLKSYASIIMSVVFAPIFLMMGALPGKNAFGPWIKNLVANLAAFPAVLLFAIIYTVFTEEIGISGNGGFMPPFLIGNGQSGIAGYIIGLAILLALPEIVKEIKKKLGASESGFGMMVTNAAVGRAKESWNKGFMGVSARGITRGAGGWVAAPAAGATVGAGIGALAGGIRSARRGENVMQGAGMGAKLGMAGGALAGALPVAVPDTVRLAARASTTINNLTKFGLSTIAAAPIVREGFDRIRGSGKTKSAAEAARDSVTGGGGRTYENEDDLD